MRLQQHPSHQFNRQNHQQNEQHHIDDNNNHSYDDDQQLNCPMIFKTCLLGLLTCGILAFVIAFGVEMDNSPKLIGDDFSQCGDQSNVRRLVKAYAYEKIILGLLISAVVIAFSLTLFMIYLSSAYCQCCTSCFPPTQQPSSDSSDIAKYQTQLRKRLTTTILMPRSSELDDSRQHALEGNKVGNKKRQLIRQATKQQKIKHQMRRFRKSRAQIQQFNQQYARYIRNDQQFDCQCEDCGACAAYCLGCLWCRSCFDAHHYHFYNSKTQEYAYWIGYMVKTFFFGSALAYVIRVYVSLQEVGYCMGGGARQYATNLQVPMIIGIVTAVVDAFGYLHLFVQGTLLDIVTDTFHEQRKSQHSDDDDSDHQSKDDHDKKRKKHGKSEQSYSSEKHITPKQKKVLKKQQDNQEGLYQFESKYSLFKSDKMQRQKQRQSRDTDSFFIKLKTIGKKYLDNIDGQVEQKGQDKRKQNKKEIQYEEPYHHESNKKPRIQVPQLFHELPLQHVTKMQREQPQEQQPSLRQSIKVVGQLQENNNEKQVKIDRTNYELQKSKGQYGGFNKTKQQQHADKAKNNNGFTRLRKFSTQF